MSEISSRPRVFSVSAALLRKAAAAGVELTANLMTTALQSLSVAAREVYKQCLQISSQVSNEIKPLTAVQADLRLHQQQMMAAVAQHQLPPTEALQVSTLLSLTTSPYVVEGHPTIHQPLEALRQAPSTEAARRAQESLLETVAASHHKVFAQVLTIACANAARKVGFAAIQTVSTDTGMMRVIASDPSGRALVTEISADPNREPSIETEVVGVTDGSCHTLLDAFDKALEEEGVRAAPSKRKFTGGVCELATAREFIRKKVRRTAAAQAQSGTIGNTNATKRSQRLNQQTVYHHKQG